MLLDERVTTDSFAPVNLSDNAMYSLDPSEADSGAGVRASSVAVRQTVHVVADAPRERASIAHMIFAAGHHAEVYADAAELAELAPQTGIVLVHEAGGCGAAEVCESLARHIIWLPVIGFGDVVAADRIVAGMKAGAVDFLVGAISANLLMAKIVQYAREGAIFSEVRCRKTVANAALLKLSQREREVLDRLVEGYSNKEIARELAISPRTVEIHRMKMMAKLGAKSGAHAVRIRIEAVV